MMPFLIQLLAESLFVQSLVTDSSSHQAEGSRTCPSNAMHSVHEWD